MPVLTQVPAQVEVPACDARPIPPSLKRRRLHQLRRERQERHAFEATRKDNAPPRKRLCVRAGKYTHQENDNRSHGINPTIDSTSYASRRDELQYSAASAAPTTQTKIPRLPYDILLIIFKLGAVVIGEPQKSSADEHDPVETSAPVGPVFQVSCSQVCKEWRAAAFGCSYLWSRYWLQSNLSDFRLVEGVIASHPHINFHLTLNLACYWMECSRSRTYLNRTARFFSTYGANLTSLDTGICYHRNAVVFDNPSTMFPKLQTIRLVRRTLCRSRRDTIDYPNAYGVPRTARPLDSVRTLVIAVHNELDTMRLGPWLHSFSKLTSLSLETSWLENTPPWSLVPPANVIRTSLDTVRQLHVDSFTLPWLVKSVTMLSSVEHVILMLKIEHSIEELQNVWRHMPHIRELYCDATLGEIAKAQASDERISDGGRHLLIPLLRTLMSMEGSSPSCLLDLRKLTLRTDASLAQHGNESVSTDTLRFLAHLVRLRTRCSTSLQSVEVRPFLQGDTRRELEMMVHLECATSWPAHPFRSSNNLLTLSPYFQVNSLSDKA